MNTPKILKKLEEKRAEIIQDAECLDCGASVHFILSGVGSDQRFYQATEKEQITIVSQNGQSHLGYPFHICADKKGEL